jgi:hypothetical protein
MALKSTGLALVCACLAYGKAAEAYHVPQRGCRCLPCGCMMGHTCCWHQQRALLGPLGQAALSLVACVYILGARCM